MYFYTPHQGTVQKICAKYLQFENWNKIRGTGNILVYSLDKKKISHWENIIDMFPTSKYGLRRQVP